MRIVVLGAGSWGLALADVLGGAHDVHLWSRSAAVVAELRTTRSRPPFFDGTLSSGIDFTASLDEALRDASIVLFAVPTHAMRATANVVGRALTSNPILVSAAKGFEIDTHLTMTSVLSDVVGGGHSVAAISGPNIAPEIAGGLPAATVVASADAEAAALVRDACNTDRLRFYSTTDVIGVEYAGALKNVVAIAAGVSDGIGVGDNGKAAIITRGIAEMARLGVRAGAEPLTFAGLAGLGDCIVTCTSIHSRNRRLGEALGRGISADQATAPGPMVTEGVNACRAARGLSRRYGVELPICDAVHAVLFEGVSVADAVSELMQRDPGDELRGLSEDLSGRPIAT